ncbi:hypothetical protein SCHPADRAFT_841230, partial [Schizopora paradoxa]
MTPLLGFKWDSINYSCAYDSVLPLVYQAWRVNQSNTLQQWSLYQQKLTPSFKKLDNIGKTRDAPEKYRNLIRNNLHKDFPRIFPFGHDYASAGQVLEKLLTFKDRFVTKSTTCSTC